MAHELQERSQRKRPAWLIPLIVCSLFTLIGASYYAFGRPQYRVLFSDLRAGDAAAIVTQLKKDGVSYRLAQGGATILVPAQKHDAAQLAIAGSGLSLNGIDGFELFNNSDMGLTDFAQKIKYQRALQGELARTIMMMEGVKEARVHLAIPERSVFRGDQLAGKAAVSITWRSPEFETASQVWGIQKLVASSIPGLNESEVAVLNGRGQFLNVTVGTSTLQSQQTRSSLNVNEIRTIIAQVLGSLPFEVTYDMQAPNANASLLADDVRNVSPLNNGDVTNSPINPILVTTRETLSADLQEQIKAEILASNITATGILGERDQTFIRFQTNANFAPPSRQNEQEMVDLPKSKLALPPSIFQTSSVPFWAIITLIISTLFVSLFWSIKRFTKPKLSPESHAEFAQILKEALQARFRGASVDAS